MDCPYLGVAIVTRRRVNARSWEVGTMEDARGGKRHAPMEMQAYMNIDLQFSFLIF